MKSTKPQNADILVELANGKQIQYSLHGEPWQNLCDSDDEEYLCAALVRGHSDILFRVAPEQILGWVNVYRSQLVMNPLDGRALYVFGEFKHTEQEARICGNRDGYDHVALIPIMFEPGRGLSPLMPNVPPWKL